uniref:Uncharacterized protein n=1 Tax=Plectus sambesii TaxID=2011161 RepID=A0A914WKX2_9BILA
MKTILCLSLLLCVAGALLEDSESRDVNRPSSYHEFIKNQLKATKPKNKTLSTAPASSTSNDTALNQPLCWDSRLAGYVTSGLQLYPADMGRMAQYVLDQ